MTHQQEHEDLSIKLSEAKTAAQSMYEEYHNGDKKLNRKIMDVRDSVGAAMTMLIAHKNRTAGADKKVERYDIMVKTLWVVIPVLIGSITKHLGMW